MPALTPLILGQRVQTPLGPATIIGFEEFFADGMKARIVKDDTGGRAECQLDQPDNWLHTPYTPNPFMFRSQLADLAE